MMSTLRLTGWRDRQREILPGIWEKKVSYFDLHPITEIVRGLVYTSLLWGLLAVGVYAIYSMVLGSH